MSSEVKARLWWFYIADAFGGSTLINTPGGAEWWKTRKSFYPELLIRRLESDATSS
jgi:hypothetical protein